MQPLRPSRRRWSSAGGFTIVEMILAVTVMAILASVTAPPVFQFMRQRDRKAEQIAQLEIQRALRAYALQNLTYPADAITYDTSSSNYAKNWFVLLAPYTKISMHNLIFDIWGNERRYVATTVNSTIQGVSVPVAYATLISAGADGKASSGCNNNGNGAFTDNSVAGGALNGFTAASDPGQWRGQGGDTPTNFAKFSCIGSGRDEILLKTTDLADKVQAYQLTIRRLNNVITSLESYSKARQSEAQIAYVSNPTTVKNGANANATPASMIYYPRGQLDSQADDPVNRYDLPVLTATGATRNNPGNQVIANSTNVATRYESLVTLMRQLGLPDSDCCSALAQFNNGGVSTSVPFYYSSNPRAVISPGVCGSRPDPTAGGITLPARVSTLPPTDPNACY